MIRIWRRNREPSEATKSRQKAERDLEATRAETPKYVELARSLVQVQNKNHLGQTAAQVLQGKTKP